MSDVAAARREARRRRILENSSDRLQRIAGKYATPLSTPTEQSHEASPVPESYDIQNLITELNEPDFTNDLSSVHSILQASTIQEHAVQNNVAVPQLTDFLNSLSMPSNRNVETSHPTLLDRVIASKLDVVLLSLFIQLLYSTLVMSQNILLPIAIHEIAKVWLFSRRQEGGMVSALLLMNGIPPSNVKKIVVMVNSVKTVMQDLCIFMFVTVCVQSLYQAFKPKFSH